MPVALVELRLTAAGPDRLADAAQRAPGAAVRRDEVVPGGDDAAGVASERLHLGELDAGCVLAQLGPEAAGAVLADRHEHGLAAETPATTKGTVCAAKSSSPS